MSRRLHAGGPLLREEGGGADGGAGGKRQEVRRQRGVLRPRERPVPGKGASTEWNRLDLNIVFPILIVEYL